MSKICGINGCIFSCINNRLVSVLLLRDPEPSSLLQDLQELLDSSPQGVIYFSMGSVLRSAAFQPPLRAALLKLFGSLPYTVLWKFEEALTDLPPNVHVRAWLPQPSVLGEQVERFLGFQALFKRRMPSNQISESQDTFKI